MAVKDSEDPVDGDEYHDVDGDAEVSEEEEGKVSTYGDAEAHELTTSVRKSTIFVH